MSAVENISGKRMKTKLFLDSVRSVKDKCWKRMSDAAGEPWKSKFFTDAEVAEIRRNARQEIAIYYAGRQTLRTKADE